MLKKTSNLNWLLTRIWLVLLLATAASLLVAEFGPIAAALGAREATATILLVAFFKVRLVILHFMEIGASPLPLQLVFELWMLLTCGALLLQLCYLPAAA